MVRIVKFTKTIIKLGIFFIIAVIITYLGVYIYAAISPKLNIESSGTYFIYDNNDNLVYQGSSSSEWVYLEDINNYAINAVLAIEDKNFYKHHGFDILRIGKAMLTNIQNGKIVEGASTVTQQLVKNLYLDFDKTWERKGKEAFLTIIAEMQYEKDEILEAYLNTINYGQGNYGISNASQYYFNKKSSDLSLEEAIMLAGIPKSPNNYNPVTNKEKCIKRAKIVAKLMLKEQYITNEEYNRLNFDNVSIYGKNKEHNLQMLMYYQDAVLDELRKLGISNDVLEKGGLKIYTTLDLNKQTILEENILKSTENIDNLQVASIIVDPISGKVEALTGGINYAKSEYNRATKSKRQVGSTMKPFLYYAGLENNMTAASTFKSEATTFNINNKQTYSPKNHNEKYANKEISMAAAIAFSDNIYAVKTNLFLGVDTLIEVANRCGIKEELKKNASLALGTSEINMLDYATGYTTLASGGYKNKLYFIQKIVDIDGKIIYEHKENKKLVLNPNYVYILNELLTNTTNSNFKDYTSATALSIASKLSRKYAIKTGTTEFDYWTIGYNKEDLMLIWLGYDDNKEFTTGYGYVGKNIWAETMENIQSGLENTWYETPQNVVGVLQDAVTGNLTTDQNKAVMYYYLKGTEPTKAQIVTKEEKTDEIN